MNQTGPIQYSCPVKLGDFGLSEKNFTFSGINMQSDRYICVKDADAGQVSLIVEYLLL
jgi:hypothetical protein